MGSPSSCPGWRAGPPRGPARSCCYIPSTPSRYSEPRPSLPIRPKRFTVVPAPLTTWPWLLAGCHALTGWAMSPDAPAVRTCWGGGAPGGAVQGPVQRGLAGAAGRHPCRYDDDHRPSLPPHAMVLSCLPPCLPACCLSAHWLAFLPVWLLTIRGGVLRHQGPAEGAGQAAVGRRVPRAHHHRRRLPRQPALLCVRDAAPAPVAPVLG